MREATMGMMATLALLAFCAIAPGAELYRPAYHFTPTRHWMNDPNGMVYLDGEYHLFFQYNPAATVWGPMHWGHAVSRDLVHWRQLPVALRPDRQGTIFSGSVVADLENRSGFGTSGSVPLIALYTHHDEQAKRAGRTDFQTQNLAYSVDRGRTWIPYAGNPVLRNPGLRDFRDPKVIWFEPRHRWVMTVVAGDHAEFYSSQDLKAWQHESDFGREWGNHDGVWECPDLVEMTVEGSATHKFVLLVSVNPGAPNGGSGTQYFVGDFDGRAFTLDPEWQRRLQSPEGTPSGAAWVDWGTDDYAGVTWSNLDHGRRVFLGWMSNWRYAQKIPTQTWRGAMTLPRDLTLVSSPRGLELHALPIHEIEQLRGAHRTVAPQAVTAPLELTQGLTLEAGRLELDLTLDLKVAGRIALSFSNPAGEATVFTIDRAQHRYVLDRSRSGTTDFDPQFASLQTAPIPTGSDVGRLQIWLDESSVEVFVNQGESVMTALVFPKTPYSRIGLEADREITVRSGTVYALAPARPLDALP